MATQLRIFRITPGTMDAFLHAWQTGVYPLREERDAAYYASTARVTLDPDPRQYIEQVEAFFITPALPMDGE